MSTAVLPLYPSQSYVPFVKQGQLVISWFSFCAVRMPAGLKICIPRNTSAQTTLPTVPEMPPDYSTIYLTRCALISVSSGSFYTNKHGRTTERLHIKAFKAFRVSFHPHGTTQR